MSLLVNALIGDFDDESHLGMHLALLASERYYEANGRWPGTDGDVEDENRQVQEHALFYLHKLVPGAVLGEETKNAIAEV